MNPADQIPEFFLVVFPHRLHRSLEGLQTRWLEGYGLEGEREETVEMGRSAARLTVTVLDAGQELPRGAARWRASIPPRIMVRLCSGSSGLPSRATVGRISRA